MGSYAYLNRILPNMKIKIATVVTIDCHHYCECNFRRQSSYSLTQYHLCRKLFLFVLNQNFSQTNITAMHCKHVAKIRATHCKHITNITVMHCKRITKNIQYLQSNINLVTLVLDKTVSW